MIEKKTTKKDFPHGRHGGDLFGGHWDHHYHRPTPGFIGGLILGGFTYLTIDAIISSDLERSRRKYESDTNMKMPLCTEIPPEKHVMMKDKNGKEIWECAKTTDDHQICFYWDANKEKKLSCYIP